MKIRHFIQLVSFTIVFIKNENNDYCNLKPAISNHTDFLIFNPLIGILSQENLYLLKRMDWGQILWFSYVSWWSTCGRLIKFSRRIWGFVLWLLNDMCTCKTELFDWLYSSWYPNYLIHITINTANKYQITNIVFISLIYSSILLAHAQKSRPFFFS